MKAEIKLMAFGVALAAMLIFAVDSLAASPLNDGIDRTDPNFVKASLIVAGPGKSIFSGVGHIAFRMECPTFGHDYCYSYEGEPIDHQVLRFFAGKLKMGMLAFKTEDFLADYREADREVMQYALNLPPEVELRLWKVFDDKLSQKMTQPYDYNERGCARAAFLVLREALSPLHFDAYSWPEKYAGTRRELTSSRLSIQPWSRFFLHAIWGTAVDDANIAKIDKVVIPQDLLEFLKTATLNGTPLITDAGTKLVVGTQMPPPSAISPMVVTIGILILTLASVLAVRFGGIVKAVRRGWQGAMLLLYALAGLFFAYMVLVSDLPATEWNWLFVPFNPLPLLLWPWRRRLALPFSVLLLGWIAFMLVAPHQLTDPAYCVLAFAYSVLFASFGRFQLKEKKL